MTFRRLYCAASLPFIFIMTLYAETLPAGDNTDVQEVSGTEVVASLPSESESPDNGAIEIPSPAGYEPLPISGSDDPLVDKYRKYYLTPGGIKWLSTVLDSGEQYRLYIRRQLKERNMPALLEYLPVVESSFKPDARSKAGAVGLWQFMPNSTKPFLIRNDFVDERLDPWKSTDAALTKLQENYTMFQDWPIAIAAYNCGAGAMMRVLKKYPEKDFWYLAEHKLLRDQSVQYVPKLIAIADLAQNSAYYNISLPAATENGEPVNPRAGCFDYVQVDGAVSLRRLANELRMDEDIFLSLNSALIRGITPPSGSYNIRVPEGMEQSARDALTSITPYHFQTKYTVEDGDSLWRIAKKYNITVRTLCGANNISEKAILKIGKILYIPAE